MTDTFKTRYFSSYSGVKLPLKLVGEIAEEDMGNRNTYYQASFDQQNRLCVCRKIVYGENELQHLYSYYDSGILKQAIISESGDEDEVTILKFDAEGRPTH